MIFDSGLHVCRGNRSRDESTLLSGGYQSLRPYLARLGVTQRVLEYATDRAGALVAFDDKEVRLGAVNPRTEYVETPAQIRNLRHRPMYTLEIATAKIAAMVTAARDLGGH